MVDYGSDYSTFRADGRPGLTYRRITGRRVPLERVARRLLGDRGSNVWARDMGIDLTRLENSDPSALDLQRYQAFARNEALAVDHVSGADFTITLLSTGTIFIDGKIVLTGDGTYPLQVTAGAASAALFPGTP